MELLKVNNKKNTKALIELLAPFTVIAVCAQIYGTIRSDLENSGNLIGAMDMLIASVAIAKNLTLIKNIQKELQRIPNLMIVNWVK